MNYPQQYIKPYNEDDEETEQVERMLDNIAYAYGKLNHILSLSTDRSQCRKAIAWPRPFHPQHIMDATTGTGGSATLARCELNPDELIETNISKGMMNVSRKKIKKEGPSDRISFVRRGCTSLSFTNNRFDVIIVTFDIRNFEDLDEGLFEMCRVLKLGGHLAILELTTPDRFPMKQLFAVYLRVVIPLLGEFLSKDNSAYHYLPDIIRMFFQEEIMKGAISKAGFDEAHFRRLAFGICTLCTATKQ